jgi:hypothetical protein
MKRLAVILVLTMFWTLGFAQGQKTAQQDSAFMGWVHDAWKTVQEKGKPAAEAFVRQWPKRFQSVKKEVADLTKTVRDKVAAMDLEQKKNIALELWRVRKSLDLMTLLDPDVLHSLTGLDVSTVSSLESQVQHLLAVVNAEIKIQKH